MGGWSPLVAEDGAPHVEPDGLAFASLHHRRRRRSPRRVAVEVEQRGGGDGAEE
jgi:hypothetical protein